MFSLMKNTRAEKYSYWEICAEINYLLQGSSVQNKFELEMYWYNVIMSCNYFFPHFRSNITITNTKILSIYTFLCICVILKYQNKQTK